MAVANASETKVGGLAEPPSKALLEISKSNSTLVSWLVFLAFGGGLLVLHYARIGYLPIVRLEDAISYLFAMSLIGGGFGLLYGLLLYFPGVIWSEFLIFDAYLKGQLCYETGDGLEPCLLSISQMLAIPFTFVMVIAHLALIGHPSSSLLTGECTGGMVVASSYLWWRLRRLPCLKFKHDPCTPGLLTATPSALLLKYLLTFVVSSAISVASLIVIARVMDPTHHDRVLLVVCTTIVILTNLLVAAQFRNRRARSIVTAFLAALILLCADEFMTTTDIPMSGRILARFGIESVEEATQGSQNSVIVFVNSRGIELLSRLRQAGLSVQVQVDASGGRIEGAHILSRLGSEYFMRVGAFRFTLPKEFVSSWLRADPKPPLSSSSAVDSQHKP